ncbi:uncharacterized protein UV8b_01813 [Ustilaginoidea virens]|uniref:Uncharacterized protein n=1 Tax=Ustilaginoidea virens TaxID=1159556 RepID=A0A8E5MFK6_USTVR|nr:uncharacterized protein UV8b_01813 [Ustilaginoidea virens]QUC17572.1 hypothetical protein UV8b_01813 [Ustilaginoidea virens]
MLYSPVKFRLTVVKPYNYDPNIDDPKDIVYAEGPARPSRLEVRIPAAAAPPAAITLAAATYPSPATSPNQVRLVSPAHIISNIIINKDQEEALVNTIASNTIINISFLTAKE